jgi:hypothetical protein
LKLLHVLFWNIFAISFDNLEKKTYTFKQWHVPKFLFFLTNVNLISLLNALLLPPLSKRNLLVLCDHFEHVTSRVESFQNHLLCMVHFYSVQSS